MRHRTGVLIGGSMMRSYGFLLQGVGALLLMLVPRLALAQSEMLDVRILCSPLEVHEGRPDEKPCLTELADVAKRDGHALTLKLKNGKTKVISNTKECDDPHALEGGCVRYRLVGYIGDRQFIMQVLPYECADAFLVNRRTGEQTKLGGLPYLSPNKKHFVVTASTAAGECDPPYNVAIFSLASDPPRLEWRFSAPDDYEGYLTDGWDGENRVRLHGYSTSKSIATPDLKLTAQGWQLKRFNGELSLGERVTPPAQPNSQRPATQPANATSPIATPGR
jgi:hypothetical protein